MSENYIRLNKTLGQSYYEYFIALFGYSIPVEFMFHPFLLYVKKRRFLFTQNNMIIKEFVFKVTSNFCKIPFANLFSFPKLSGGGWPAKLINRVNGSQLHSQVAEQILLFSLTKDIILVTTEQNWYFSRILNENGNIANRRVNGILVWFPR